MTSDLTDLTSNVKLLEFPLKGHHGVSVSLRTCPPPPAASVSAAHSSSSGLQAALAEGSRGHDAEGPPLTALTHSLSPHCERVIDPPAKFLRDYIGWGLFCGMFIRPLLFPSHRGREALSAITLSFSVWEEATA